MSLDQELQGLPVANGGSADLAEKVAALNARFKHHSATSVMEGPFAMQETSPWSLPLGRNRWCCCIWRR